MTPSPLCSILVATALIHAPFAQAHARMVTVSNCNGGMSVLLIPGDDSAPGKGGDDCAKACHATCERRDRKVGKRLG